MDAVAHRSWPRPLHRILVAIAWWRGDQQRDFANVVDIFIEFMEWLGQCNIPFRITHLHRIRRRVRRRRCQRKLGRRRDGARYADQRAINEQREKRWKLRIVFLIVIFVLILIVFEQLERRRWRRRLVIARTAITSDAYTSPY
jgi:hypothetical protein